MELLAVFLRAADGVFPPEDGIVEFAAAPNPGQSAIVSFTAHTIIATDRPQRLDDLSLDGYGGALEPSVQSRLAGPSGIIGVLDATLFARGTGDGSLPLRSDLDDHPRVRYANRLRTEVRVHGDDRGLVTLARGLAGRREMSIEVSTPGSGRELIAEALALTPAGEPLFAAVSPGNARSLRAFLAAGFVPIGSEVIISWCGR